MCSPRARRVQPHVGTSPQRKEKREKRAQAAKKQIVMFAIAFVMCAITGGGQDTGERPATLVVDAFEDALTEEAPRTTDDLSADECTASLSSMSKVAQEGIAPHDAAVKTPEPEEEGARPEAPAAAVIPCGARASELPAPVSPTTNNTAAPPPSPSRSCLACSKFDSTLLRCSRCQSVYFCSREHQAVAWPMQEEPQEPEQVRWRDSMQTEPADLRRRATAHRSRRRRRMWREYREGRGVVVWKRRKRDGSYVTWIRTESTSMQAGERWSGWETVSLNLMLICICEALMHTKEMMYMYEEHDSREREWTHVMSEVIARGVSNAIMAGGIQWARGEKRQETIVYRVSKPPPPPPKGEMAAKRLESERRYIRKTKREE